MDTTNQETKAEADPHIPEFTFGQCGGNACIWWGGGDYLCGFGMDQMWLVEILCKALNEKRGRILSGEITMDQGALLQEWK